MMRRYNVKLAPERANVNDEGMVVHAEIMATDRRMLRRRLRDYFDNFIILDIKAAR